MVASTSKFEQVNVLASEANWAWPNALRDIFRPRGVNLLVAESTDDFIDILRRQRIHTTIIDMDSENANGLATIKVIRMDYPRLPCIMLTSSAEPSMLEEALRLEVFAVVDKPVDMTGLNQLLNRLFMKRYNSDIFKM